MSKHKSTKMYRSDFTFIILEAEIFSKDIHDKYPCLGDGKSKKIALT